MKRYELQRPHELDRKSQLTQFVLRSNDVTDDEMNSVYFECCNENDDSCNDYYDYSDEEDCSKDWLELGRDFIISLYTQILDLFLTVDGYNALFKGVDIEDEFSISNETVSK